MNWAVELFREHKSKLYWAVGFSTGAYALSEYLKSRLLSLQAEFLNTHARQNNIIQRFEQNQQDSVFTVLSFLPEISTSVFSELNAELITSLLQAKSVDYTEPDGIRMESTLIERLSHMSKPDLWEELKIVTLTRLFVSAYSLTLLTLFTRLQLNTIGRYIYFDSVFYDNPHPISPISKNNIDSIKYTTSLPSSIEQMYLTFSWYFLREGWKEFAKKVKSSVSTVFGGLSLKTEITKESITQWFNQVRNLVESEIDSQMNSLLFCSILMPPEEKEYEMLENGGIFAGGEGKVEDPLLRRLLDETRDVLESPTFYRTFLDCSTSIFNLVLIQFEPCFQNQKNAKLASLLPISKQLPQSILSGSPNNFNLALAENPSLRSFSMLIYTLHFDIIIEFKESDS